MSRLMIILLVAGSAVSAAKAQNILWNNAAGGSWNTASNWLPANVPDSGSERAVISLTGPYVVTLDNGVSLGGLELTGSGATLHIANSEALTLVADVLNDRTIVVNHSAGSNGTVMQFTVNGVLGGSGEVVLNANAGSVATAILRSSGLATSVRQSAGHRVRGTGSITGTFINEGVVLADVEGRLLDVGASTTNNGTVGANADGILRVSSDTFAQGPHGRLLADAGIVQLSGTTLTGGRVVAMAGGVTQVVTTTSQLADTIVEGPMAIANSRTLAIGGAGLTNNGVITVNETAGANGTALQFGIDGTLGGAGEVVLNANAGNTLSAVLRSSGFGSVVRQGASHSVRGAGSISGTLVNDGSIWADVPGRLLDVAAATTNNATAGAVSGGVLRISSDSFSQGAAGRVLANGGTVQLGGAQVFGGTIEAAGGGVCRVVDTTSYVSGVSIAGPMTISNGRMLVVRGVGLTNNGVLTVNETAGLNGTALQFEVDGSLAGSGEVVLNANAASVATAVVRTSGFGAVVRQGRDHVIRGAGSITGTMVNDGVVLADVPDRVLELGASTSNNGTVGAVGGGVLRLTTGTFDQGGGGRLRADGGRVELDGATVTDGLIEATGGGVTRVVTTTSIVTNVRVVGPLAIANSQILVVRGSGLTNDGVITVNDTAGANGTALQFEVPGTLGGSGAVILNGSGANNDTAVLRPSGFATSITNAEGHTIGGRGRVRTPFTNAGRFSPGPLSGGADRLDVVGGWTNAPSARIDIEVGGAEQGLTYDHIASTGAVTLDGTINVALVDSFLPARGAWFDVMTAAAFDGTFDVENLPELPLDYGFARIQYTDTAVKLRIPLCRADWNAIDGLNSQDFFDFLTAFFAGRSDYNRDGLTNSQDFFDFLTNFFMPCA